MLADWCFGDSHTVCEIWLGKPKWSSCLIITELLAKLRRCTKSMWKKTILLEAYTESLKYQQTYCNRTVKLVCFLWCWKLVYLYIWRWRKTDTFTLAWRKKYILKSAFKWKIWSWKLNTNMDMSVPFAQGLFSDITHNIEIAVICKKWNIQN